MNPYEANEISLAHDNETRPSREEAEEAVRTLIRWAGDSPEREGLTDTPSRVVRSYEEFFAGYREDAVGMLARTFVTKLSIECCTEKKILILPYKNF